MASLVFLGASLIPSFWDNIFENIFGLITEEKECQCAYISTIIFIVLTFIFSYFSYKSSHNIEENIIDKIVQKKWGLINNNELYSFTGSILNIKNIDVIVTSENQSLSLGSIYGTSVSGRIRRLAASFNQDLTLKTDNLSIAIEEWKQKQGNLGPYQMGMTIINKPFGASHNGIKSIINAISVNKTNLGEHLIDEQAIRKIINDTVQHCIKNNYKSVFIPIFGLGSGKNERQKAIAMTLDPLIDILSSNNCSIKVYIGIYRITDALTLSSFLLKSVLVNKQ